MNNRTILVWSYYALLPLFFLLIPLFYEYLLKLTETKKSGFAGNVFVLYLPAILVLIFNIFIYGNLTMVEKLSILYSQFQITEDPVSLYVFTGIIVKYVLFILAIIQISYYSYKVIPNLRLNKVLIKDDAFHLPNVDIKWLSYIFFSLVVFMIVNVVLNVLPPTYKANMIWVYNILMILTGAIIGYFGLKQENLNEYILRLSDFNNHDKSNSASRHKERSIAIVDEDKSSILNALKNLMESKKLYLDSKIKIEDLAEKLNVNKRVISIIINDEMSTNFYGYINDYRIRDSKNIIIDPEMNYLSMEGIAEKVGFSSKSSFYASFKKVTGKTPSQYKKDTLLS